MNVMIQERNLIHMIFRAIALTAIIPGTIANAGAQTSPTDSHAATAAESPIIDPRAVALLKQNQDVMPHSNSVIHKLQGRKLPVVLLAIDDWEDRTSYESWVKTNSQKFSSIAYLHIAQKKSVSTKMYGVSGIPTQFVIDGSGVVRDSFVGYKGSTKALENAILSALK